MVRLNWRKLHRLTLSVFILLTLLTFEQHFEQTMVGPVGPMRSSVFGRCFRRPRRGRGGLPKARQMKVKQRNQRDATRDPPVEVMGVKDGVAVIAGSALGGGFLALPLVTAPLGILPSLVGLGMAWAFIAALCTVYAEVSAQTLKDKAVDAVQSREDRPMLEEEGVSIVSVAQRRLGDSAAVVCSVAFLFQMLAVVTAQVAKSGELLESLMGLPYIGGCILPSIFLGLFTFEMPVKLVERTNTLLTAVMVIGFALLVVNSCMTISFAELPELISNLPTENWRPLLPAAGTTTWALPIFFNLLCYGQSVPLVVERMGAERSSKIRNTILLGSMIPLILGIIWVCVAALLGSRLNLDGAADPVLQLVHGPLSIALPVLLLAAGAIGTTLIASYLALGQFAADALCAATGSCSLEDNQRAKVASVMVPALTACIGPQLYLPLLSFAGAFPSVLLYGVLPPVALLLSRQTSKKLPGQEPVLVGLAATAVLFLLVNLWLWLTAV
eukprot:s931_g17.t1